MTRVSIWSSTLSIPNHAVPTHTRFHALLCLLTLLPATALLDQSAHPPGRWHLWHLRHPSNRIQGAELEHGSYSADTTRLYPQLHPSPSLPSPSHSSPSLLSSSKDPLTQQLTTLFPETPSLHSPQSPCFRRLQTPSSRPQLPPLLQFSGSLSQPPHQNALASHVRTLISLSTRAGVRRSLQSSPPPPAAAPPGFELLASWRTQRKNPLDGLQYWQGGWNLVSKDYWASLVWSGSPAGFTALVWVLLGVITLVTLLSLCLCCRRNWGGMRTVKGELNGTVTVVLLVLGGCALALCVAGFVTLCVGQAAMFRQVSDDVAFIVEKTENVTAAATTMANIMIIVSNVSVGNMSLSSVQQKAAVNTANEAIAAAAHVNQTVEASAAQINVFVKDMKIIIYTCTTVLVFLILVGTALSLCKLAWTSTVVIVLMWIMCVFALAMICVSTSAYNLIGDSDAAMGQVRDNPAADSAMSYILPCTNQTALSQTQFEGRVLLFSAVNLLNEGWATGEIPPIQIGNFTNITEICNPIEGPPAYMQNRTQCRAPVISLSQVIQYLNTTGCQEDPQLCAATQNTVQQLVTLSITFLAVLQILDPSLGPLLNCQYVGDIAAVLLLHMPVYYTGTYQAWAGFIILSVGALLLAVLLPVYVFRATRQKAPLEEQVVGSSEEKSTQKADVAGMDQGLLDGARPETNGSSSQV